uniref:Pyruvate, phosphate dikinase regulatory protein, chloroplastic n=1 Tax=Tanacetum cinerariifolium TaxID=118510 RepID=A0A6L2LQ49_TANCI|nr:pyruvate, phosphate dikinase regulatory protein, chloroplastic [Tanacetum cinerariifolium]
MLLFQVKDLDAYDSDCDDVSTAQAVVMANLSNYGSDVISEDKSCDNQNALEIPKYFKNNDLKAQLQAKDTIIYKLKDHIKYMRENDKDEKVKLDMDEIETINIELEHSVAKLLSENELLHKEIEHLKRIYKDKFDSIKRTRACFKEHINSLIAQLDSTSMENADLKGRFNFRRPSLTWFPAQSISSSNAIALDSPYLLVLITGTSQSNQHEVVPKVDDVSLVDEVFDGVFGGDGEEDSDMGEGVAVSYSSLDMFTKIFLGGIIMSLIFLEGLENEAWVESMEVEEK